jgi:hypothetical protein|tara:strand:+ start:3134 stop:3505 length:372 start_codon:yes stop_codon:yes gene_type:complete
MEKGIVEKLNDCRSLIESALEYGDQTHTFDDIVEGVLKGEYQFWEAPLGCAITEIVVFPRKKVLHIFLYAGELQQVLDMEESAKIWAKEFGCSAFSLSGRRGWKRVLEKRGFRELYTTLAKDI